MDEPPQFGTDEKPSTEAFGRLAASLLSEMARHDPALAKKLRCAGFDPEEHAARPLDGHSGADGR